MPSTTKQDAISLLKADHRKVEDLFEKFGKARDPSRKKALAEEACTELSVHAMIEEEIFYPACRGKADDDMLNEALVEHDGAKVLIAELMASSPDDEYYDAKMKVLSEDIKHHVKEEERPGEGIFFHAREGGLDLEALGAKLMARKQELLAKIKAEGLPPPTTRSFKGPKLSHGTSAHASAA